MVAVVVVRWWWWCGCGGMIVCAAQALDKLLSVPGCFSEVIYIYMLMMLYMRNVCALDGIGVMMKTVPYCAYQEICLRLLGGLGQGRGR